MSDQDNEQHKRDMQEVMAMRSTFLMVCMGRDPSVCLAALTRSMAYIVASVGIEDKEAIQTANKSFKKALANARAEVQMANKSLN